MNRRSTQFPMPPCGSASAPRTALITAQIMYRWPKGATVEDLTSRFGMSRAQAFRYLAAIREAGAIA